MVGRFAMAVCAVAVLVLPTSVTLQEIPRAADLIRESAEHPENPHVQSIVEATAGGYRPACHRREVGL